MFTCFRIAMGTALLFALGVAIPVLAGGWAVITLDELPSNLVAGQELTVGFTVLQHGKTPMNGLEPTITLESSSGEELIVNALPGKKPGYYTAALTFPKEGNWNWSIQAFAMDQPMPTLIVAPSSAASAKQPVKTESASPAISPLLIFRFAVLGLGLIGLLLAFQRKSRVAAALTVLCLIIGGALFFAEAQTASGLDVKIETSTDEVANSSASQIELGRQLFVAKGCVTCHTNNKIPQAMKGAFTVDFGPDLSNFSASPEVIFMRLKDPASVKSDTQMPNLDLTEAEILALVAFINSK